MVVITIGNCKGGVGKSTTAINLSVGLTRLGKRVLLIDGCTQGNSTQGLGINPWTLPSTLLDVLNGSSLRDCILSAHGVAVVGNNLFQLAKVSQLASAMGSSENRLRDVLQGHEKHFDFVIVDTPPQVDLLLRNAITAADYIIIPIQLEPFAVSGLDFVVSEFKTSHKKILGILFTMVSARYNLTADLRARVQKQFSTRVFTTFISRSVEVADLQDEGTPIVLTTHKVGKEYLALAQEVIARVKTTPK